MPNKDGTLTPQEWADQTGSHGSWVIETAPPKRRRGKVTSLGWAKETDPIYRQGTWDLVLGKHLEEKDDD